MSRDDEQIRQRVEPHYAGHAAGMVHLLDGYDAEQVELIADFMRRVAGVR